MGIVFPRMKNDQSGERPREPRHIYANPSNPAICPILSMAIYFVCFPSISGAKVFPGEAQTERFRKQLHAVLSQPPLSTLLTELGLSPEDIGTHSIRKGSATYCSSGSTACPSAASVRYRAGWSTGAVSERYCLYEAAGDQHVGRTACGLPVDQPEFAMLPPHFNTLNTHVVNAVKSAFPTLHKLAPSVAQFCLASLLYHDAFLENTLPPSHPLRYSRYYKAEQRKHELAQFVSCESSNSDNILRPTGVPPYVNMQVMMRTMAQELRELTTAIRTVPDELVARTQARVGDDTTNLRGTMTEVLRENGVFDAIARINAVAPIGGPAAPTNAADDQIQQQPQRTINDALMRQRPRYQLPTGTILGAWQCWFGGDNPLRFAIGQDMATKNDKKRLSDLKYLMKCINEKAPDFPSRDSPSDTEVDEAFMSAISRFGELNNTPLGGARRIDQVSWTSAATFLRKSKRQRTS